MHVTTAGTDAAAAATVVLSLGKGEREAGRQAAAAVARPWQKCR